MEYCPIHTKLPTTFPTKKESTGLDVYHSKHVTRTDGSKDERYILLIIDDGCICTETTLTRIISDIVRISTPIVLLTTNDNIISKTNNLIYVCICR